MKILVIRVKGIGNMVMFTPALLALTRGLPNAEMSLLADKGSIEVVRGGDIVDEMIPFDVDAPLLEKLRLLFSLRKRKFDYSIMTFPANKWQFNLFSFLIGARKRVTHGYKNPKLKTLYFLQNTRVPAVESIHDVQQNLNLLEAFGISDYEDKQFFYVSDENIGFAKDFFKKNNLKKAIAMHPGCGDDSVYKRWPAGHFTRLVGLLQEAGYDPLLIAGPGEEDLVASINGPLEKPAAVLQKTSLKNVAAVISFCSAFLSTDSGLGHIASAMDVPTFVVIGPTDYRRIAPYGGKVITKGMPCSPCKSYPFHTDFSHIDCKDIRCLRAITPEDVRDEIFKHKAFITGRK